MSSDNAILEFTITINVKASAETEDTLQRLENAKKANNEIRQAPETEEKTSTEETQLKRLEEGKETSTEETSNEFFKKKEEESQKSEEKSQLPELAKNIDSKGISTLKNIATNPIGSILGYLTAGLEEMIPEVADLIPILGAILAAPEVASLLIKALSAKGGPLNRDFLNAINKQVNVGLTLQQTKQKLEGIDLVVIAQQSGFTPNNSNWTYNSMYSMDAYRAERIGLSYRAAGFYTN